MTERSKPLMLEGCRVLDLTQYLAGAGVTRMMAELGADIIKVELTPDGDGGRLLPITDEVGRSGFFVQHNRGKKSLCVDWSKPEALEMLRELAATVDIVAENFGQGSILEKRGLDYDTLRTIKPDLIYLSVSAFGRNSPWASKPGFDYIAQAASGIMHMTGEPERPPALVWSAIGDTNTAVHGFASVGYALYHRERTGEGQQIDLSMTDCLFHFHEGAMMAHHLTKGEFEPKRFGSHHKLVFPAGVFQGPEGWIVILAVDRQWVNVCKAIDRPDLADDPRYAAMADRTERQDELIPIIEAYLSRFATDQEALDHLEAHRVPASPVLSPIDAIGHPHYEARDMVRWVDDPVLDTIPIPGFPFKFSAQPELPDIQAPLLGEHNDQILKESLGYDDARIADLVATGVLHAPLT